MKTKTRKREHFAEAIQMITLRMLPDEKQRIDAAARQADQSINCWCMASLLDAARLVEIEARIVT